MRFFTESLYQDKHFLLMKHFLVVVNVQVKILKKQTNRKQKTDIPRWIKLSTNMT